MPKIPFRERLAQNRPILADGAMGTNLHGLGIALNSCFDALNLSDPALVASIHRRYLEAGAEIIETNTFSANPYKLGGFKLEHKTIEINQAGVELAQRVVEASFRDDVYIAGSVGPLGVYLAPFGRVREEDAARAFRKQIGALIHGGVDYILFETFSDTRELEIAVNVARDIKPDIPISVSMTFTRDDRTLMGETPNHVARTLAATKSDVIGINCSGGPAQLRRILMMMKQIVGDDVYLSVMPNAGWPEQVSGRVIYPATADYFGEYALAFADAGACIIGGCCGTTPDHIKAMRDALDDETRTHSILLSTPVEEQELNGDVLEPPTQLQQKLANGQFVVTVEMTPPKGFVTQRLLAAADMLKQAGVDTINIPDSPRSRLRMSPWAAAHLIQDRIGIETILYFPTRGRNILRVQSDLLAAHALDVRNIFVVMGDPTHIGDYPDASNTQDVVPSGLIHIIKKQLNAGVDQAGNEISQSTSFFVGTALNLNREDIDKEVNLLKKKVEAGADYALTQPIYEAKYAKRFIERYQDLMGEAVPIPIIAGLLPLYNERHATFLHNEVPGIFIPEHLQKRVEGAEDGSLEGVAITQELLLELKDTVQGAYIMPPFGKYHLAAEVADVLTLGMPT